MRDCRSALLARGGRNHRVIVNNSVFSNDTGSKYGEREFQIQCHSAHKTVENNIMDNNTLNRYLIDDYTSSGPALLGIHRRRGGNVQLVRRRRNVVAVTNLGVNIVGVLDYAGRRGTTGSLNGEG
jgi:hypothetical protein